MSAERALVSKVAQSRSGASELAAEGFTEEHFFEDDCLEVWKFVLDHLGRYGRQPTVPTIMKQFPEFDFEMSEEPIQYLKEQLVHDMARRLADEFSYELAQAAGNPENGSSLADMILERGRIIKNILPFGSIGRFSDARQRITVYEERVISGVKYVGYLTGIQGIDEATLGIHEGELVQIVGWQGLGKSTLAQWIALNLYQQGARILFISLEMDYDALFRRWDQMLNQFTSLNNLKQINLSDAEVERWKDAAGRLEEGKQTDGRDIIVRAGGSWTPERVHGEIVLHDPHVVMIDYITLMDTSSTGAARWERISQLSRELKEIAMTTRKPIFSIAQTNRESAKKGAELDTIGGAYMIGADSDIVIGLHQSDEMRMNKLMELRLNKNRDGDQPTIPVFWDPAKMHFEQSFAEAQIKKTRGAHKLGEATQSKEAVGE